MNTTAFKKTAQAMKYIKNTEGCFITTGSIILLLMLRKRQSRKIFVEITQTMFRKVQRTEISFV